MKSSFKGLNLLYLRRLNTHYTKTPPKKSTGMETYEPSPY